MERWRALPASWLPWAVYGPLAALGAALSWLQRGQVLTAPTGGPRLSADASTSQLLGLAIAFAVTLLTVLATRWLVRRTRWARSLQGTLRAALLGASSRRLLLLALSSSMAEELLFRAALLPTIGVLASSLIFGALHISPSRDAQLPWMLWATLMGVVFGLLFVASGSLLAPLFAHAAINYENMHYVCNAQPTATARPRPNPHGERWRQL